jgi:hypothetical protein
VTTIHIQIDRLILDGWPLDQRQARLVQSAIETELSQQMSSSNMVGQFDTGSALARATTEPVKWNTANGAATLGTQVGQAISRSIQQ